MKWQYTAIIALFVAGLAGVLIYYHGLYKDEETRANTAEASARLKQETIDDMTVRQRDNAALDAKYTGELADERAENEKLRADIATGKRKLQLNATCSKSGSTTASSLGDGESPRLTTDAELNYFSLRDGIATITKQVSYLQDYIRQQCLK